MNKKGFTLVELLVVLVIIGIIVALILPNALRAINRANERECASNIRAINTAMQLCYTQTRDWTQCDTVAELTADGVGVAYLDQAPVCPFNVAYTIPGSAGPGNPTAVTATAHFANWPNGGHVGVEN